MESLRANPSAPAPPPTASSPSDAELLEHLRRGDDRALPSLMDRYDRLVRYTIFQYSRASCFRDPQWLDAVASEAWMGLIRSVRRPEAQIPANFKAFLAQIARNQAITSLRRRGWLERTSPETDFCVTDFNAASLENAGTHLELYEQFVALRECVIGLDEPDREVFSQLEFIVERRWTEAAGRLEISESTLRYRWKLILERLKSCMESKFGRDFAPRA